MVDPIVTPLAVAATTIVAEKLGGFTVEAFFDDPMRIRCLS